jgi:hypothetical protein
VSASEREDFGFEFEILFAGISVLGAPGEIRSHKEAIMRLPALLFFLILPVASFAQHVGDLSPNPFSSNAIGNPFDSGGPWSVIPPRNQIGGRVSPTNPYTWSNPLAIGPPQPFEGGGQFRSLSPLNQNQTGPRLGPYGIMLSPGHPLGMR